MIYENRSLSFSLVLPDGWRREVGLLDRLSSRSALVTFHSGDERATLNISSGPAGPNVPRATSDRGRQLLDFLNQNIAQMGQRVSPYLVDRRPGNAPNTVWGEFRPLDWSGDAGVRGLISVIHEDREYVIQYMSGPQSEPEIAAILDSFCFTPELPEAARRGATVARADSGRIRAPLQPSFGLSRLLGFAGFLLLGTLALRMLGSLMGIDASLCTLGQLGGKGSVLFLAAIVSGALGVVGGQLLGASVRIRDDRLSDLLDAAWHFGAFAILVWATPWLVVMSLTASPGSDVCSWSTALALLLQSVMLGWCLLVQVWVIGRRIGNAISQAVGRRLGAVLAVATGMAVGVLQASNAQLAVWWGLSLGAIAPVALVELALAAVRKDSLRRQGMRTS